MYKSRPVLLVVFILLIGALGCAQNSQQVVKKKPAKKSIGKPEQYRWVSGKSGLTVRSTPGTSGEKVGAIPFGTEVLLISEEGDPIELAGRKGKWSKISWYGPDGWVFGGFLSDEEVKPEE